MDNYMDMNTKNNYYVPFCKYKFRNYDRIYKKIYITSDSIRVFSIYLLNMKYILAVCI